ncbi:uncharacterized protein LOC143062140 [Mytilus galloprovincialis]|uniref:uncharacterized protein LOC143062140 n=1 Tax=Mytilus galloprovincialis TaxID=29158 RepID=UPI003F7CBADC
MKYFFAVLVLSLCIAGLHAAKKQHMGRFNFDQFCPHDPKGCHRWCLLWNFDEGKCEGPGRLQCWCYWYITKPSLQGKSAIGKQN